MSRKSRVFWPLLASTLLADCTTKQAVVDALWPPGRPHQVIGETVRFTLAFNDGGAMGLPTGPLGRMALGLFGLAAAAVLVAWYRRGRNDDTRLAAALALVTAGALGNAWQRVLSSRGVVDFIDVGIGPARFWAFNVADACLTVGAVLLAVAMWTDGRDRGVARE